MNSLQSKKDMLLELGKQLTGIRNKLSEIGEDVSAALGMDDSVELLSDADVEWFGDLDITIANAVMLTLHQVDRIASRISSEVIPECERLEVIDRKLDAIMESLGIEFVQEPAPTEIVLAYRQDT